jgi:hypothetical protein
LIDEISGGCFKPFLAALLEQGLQFALGFGVQQIKVDHV